MHSVYDIIPRENFSPLSAPKASLFLELLFRLWRVSNATTGMISQAAVSDIAMDMALDPETAPILEAIEDDRVKEMTPERFAADAVQQLVHWRWLSAENDATFSTEYLFSPGGSMLLEFLGRLGEGAHDEVVTAVLRIHDGLNQAVERQEDRHTRIFDAQRVADQFVNELKTLRLQLTALNNMLSSEMQRHEIFDVLLGDAHHRALDLLHRLNNTHHISRYRPAINQYVERLLESAMLRAAAAAAHESNPSISVEDHVVRIEAALVHIQQRLDYAKNELLDPLLAAEGHISHRADALFRAAQIDTRTLRHRLLRIAKAALGQGVPLPDDFFRLDIMEHPPQRTFPNLVRVPRVFQPAKVSTPKLTPAELRAEEEKALHQAKNYFGPEALNAWLAERVAGRDFIRASELTDLPLPGVHLITNLWEWRAFLDFDLRAIPDAERVTAGNARFDDFVIAVKGRPAEGEPTA